MGPTLVLDPGGGATLVLGPGGGVTGGWSPDAPGWGEAGYSFGGGVRVTSKLAILDGLGLGEYGGVLGVGVVSLIGLLSWITPRP